MASTSIQTPSPSPTFNSQWSYDVFLSFRGEDTRRNFTDHLYSTLNRNNIRTFRDDEELPRGGEIAPELLTAIEESRIAIIVFSKNYAFSKWCLEELVQIMKCREEREQIVIPIFYHVDPSEVRNQTGICGEAFTYHEENADEERKEKIRKWRAAMGKAGDLAGYDVKTRYESELIDEIIEKIHGSVPKILDVNENIVGMDFRLEKLMSLLKIELNDVVRMVGVYGLGGIGKTTIINALYNKISYQFKSISLLTNVREESTKDSDLLKLQQQLLDDTLGTKGQIILRNIHEGVKVIKDKLSSKKVLILLDDVDELKQLEHLIGKHDWFGQGSRIVITTRKKNLLTVHGVDATYEVDKLNVGEAIQLFCCYAFKQLLPKEGYGDLSHQVVQYADGLPLALKVWGPLFFGKGLLDWRHELDKMENVPNMEIVKKLKISYEGLDYTQKSIFLDIACFFNGEDMQRLSRILNGSGFNAESGINALIDRCLITISKNNTIDMHDLLAHMGEDIVDQECPNEPGERSRLWRYMDIDRVLKRNTGTKKIEGLFLNKYLAEQIEFTSEAFRRMNRLRLLEVTHNNVQLSEDFVFPSDDLTYLYWDGYSLESLPSNFHANNLVELHLRNSNIKLLWKGNMYLRNLRRINLSGSQQLIELPNFSTVPNLEALFLSGCVNIENLPGDIHQLKHLLTLHCNGCSRLTSFPKIKRNIGELVELRLDETAIKELPSSIELLEGLRDLYLNNCKNLESLPNSICNLRLLKVLSLDGCSKLDKLPKDLERMPSLEVLSLNSLSCQLPSLSGLSLLSELHLDQCNLRPGVIKSDNCLNALKQLSLRNCNLNGGGAFNHIFHLFSLEVLNLSGCNPEEGGILSDILVGISQLSNLRALDLSHCKKLSQIPELPSSLRLLDAHNLIGTSLPPMHSLVNCLKSANQDLKHKSSSNEVFLADSDYIGHGICIVVQGSSGILEWIRNQREGSYIRRKLPQNWYENDDFLGIAICFVYVPLEECEYIPENDFAHTSEDESGDKALNESYDLLEAESSISTELACRLIIDNGYGTSQPVQHLSFRTTCKCYRGGGVSEQMWVILYPKVAIQESCHSNQFRFLEASFLGSCSNFKVLKCGFQPIYAQDPMVQTEDVDVSCLECQRNVECRKLCLKGQTINLLPVECAFEFDTLCLRECNNLESLPTSIWELKSLKSLFCSNCSQLQCFPNILENMENLRELHLDGTAIKELPSSIDHFNRLEVLNLENCQNLVTLPESICNLCFLEVLHVSYCSKLQKLPQNMGRLQSLKLLVARGLNSMCCQLLSLSGLCSLKWLFLCLSKLMQGVIPSDIFCLNSLEVLDLSYCNIDGEIPSEIFHLSSLKQLFLRGNLFRSIPTGINQLFMLRLLDLSHCPRLLQIPELPSSLRVLDVHECTRLETSSGLLWSSLFKCFKSVIQDLEHGIDFKEKRFSQVSLIISGSSGIPNWIRHYKKGAKVVAMLPQNWYKNSDLLGFVLYSIYDPLDNKAEGRLGNGGTYFKYDLTLSGHEIQLVDDLSFYFSWSCIDVVPEMWMIYYPKVAINKKYHSNKWRQLTASFCGYLDGKAMKVEECGIHLIYAHDHEQKLDKAMISTICWQCQQDVQSRRKLCLKGKAINDLPTIESPLQFDSLCLRYCKNLERLPSSICELKSLTSLFCSGCSQLKSFPEILEDMENLRELNLKGTAIEELPASIQHLRGLQRLNLEDCTSLVSLPESICNLKSLTTLSCSGCTNLTVLPKISEKMGNFKELYLNGSSIKELPSSIELLEGLRHLYLYNCKNLESLPNSICNLRLLKVLSLDGCSKLDKLPEDLERMPSLEALSLNSLSCRSPSLSGLSLLSELHLDQCNLTPGVIKSDNCLTALKQLSLRNCNLNGGGAFNHIFHLSSLEVLNLSGCNPEEGGILSDILVGISQLSNLRALDLSHCKKLSQIPELPSSLRLLDVHNSIGTSLPPMHSLVNCLKSANQDLKHKSSSNEVFLADSDYIGHGICIVVQGSSGILEWIRNQREGSYIRKKLPQNWYGNDDFLGIAICFVYVPLEECEDIPENDFAHTSEDESGDKALNESYDLLEAESSISTELACRLIIDDGYGTSQLVQHLSFRTTCKCYRGGGVSEQMWVILYPKVAIQESCHSNQFRFLEASFLGSLSNFKVLKCGFQPIYAQDPMVQTEDVDVSCLECQRNVECRKLCLKGQTINLLPVECAFEFDTLCLRECKNLESLPTSIWESKSLKSLFCSNCSQLRCFPNILENMENLRELHLNGTAIKELPSSIEHLNRLEVLNLEICQNLVTLPESICNLCFLEVLVVNYCSKLPKLPRNLGRLQCLKILYARGLNSMCCQLLSLSGLCSLKSLFLSQSKPMQGVIPSDIFCLNSLEVLDLSYCNIDGEIPSEIFHLSSLKQLFLRGNLFRSIPAGINQLSMLRVLELSHCPELRQITGLPSSLRVLDVHECTRLETSSGLLWSSLFKCFKSVIQDLEHGIDFKEKRFSQVSLIISGSSGIPNWIRHYKKGAKVVAMLPQNWYKNSDLLGFVLYSIYDPLDNKAEGRLGNGGTYFMYDLTLSGHEIQLVDDLSFYFSWSCIDVVPKMWMIYYPKVAINKKYHSNKWRQLTASFCGYLDGKAMKVEECGIHLIYAHDHEQKHDKAMISTICWQCQQDVQSRRKLCLKGKAINDLPTIESPLQFDSLCLRDCKNLERLPSSICELKSLTSLFCSGCSQLKSFPEILEDMENLRELHLDATAVTELPASIQHLRGLQYLNLEDCTNLVSLPESICNLKSLTTLSCSGCINLRVFPEIWENMENLRELHLNGSPIEELPSSIEHLQGLQRLNLACCNNLVSLPERICNLKSLTTLSCYGCSNLRVFPEISKNVENLRDLYLNGTSIKELPSSIGHLQGLQCLDLENCRSLVKIPESICKLSSLKRLSVNFCTKLEKFPKNLRSLQCLEHLGAAGFDSNLVLGALQSDPCYMSSWEALNLSMNCFSNIPAGINQLSKLRSLNLSHCHRLLQVPELPPSLRDLDVHDCTCLETLSTPSSLLGFSLLKCFKSAIEEFKRGSYWVKIIGINMSGNNGIPEWISQKKDGSQITVELPMDWYKNNDFLGFALYSAFDPMACPKLNCELNFCGDGSECWHVDNVRFMCCQICGESTKLCVAYYPKVAIENQYWSNKWRSLKASFHSFDGEPVEVKECGFHLIYTPINRNIPQDTSTDAQRSYETQKAPSTTICQW